MILNERDSRHEQVLQVAQQMMTAARTAPKGKGVDIIEVAMVTESNIRILSDTMKQMYEDNGFKFFLRDADNILQAECVVLIGTRSLPQGLDCGHCGYEHCGDRKKGVPCAINSVDVGIAIGSACSVAADHRVDTRVMFSAGLAAQQLDWLDGCTQVYAIPVSASSKIRSSTGSLRQNKFFSRVGHAVFFIGQSDEVGVFFYYLLCISHGDTQSGVLNHGQVVESVADGNHFLTGKSDFLQENGQRLGLVDALRDQFQEVRL